MNNPGFIKIFILMILLQAEGLFFSSIFSQKAQADNIRIGLLLQDDKAVSVRQAAELAVRKANEKGGPGGRKIELVVKSMQGSWGTGSKQAVDLIFEENVWALIGSHDGRNAHLVEQAATKAEVVFLSCWTGDPTLSQAFVPWFFNIMPNYNQQAEVLANEIFYIKKFTRVVAVTDNTYDSNQAFQSFRRKSGALGKFEPSRLIYEEWLTGTEKKTDSLLRNNPDCIILFCSPKSSSDFLTRVVRKGYSRPVYGSINVTNEKDLSEAEMKVFENILKVPSAKWDSGQTEEVVKEFRMTYGKNPGMSALYVYDGVTAIIEAIKLAGVQDREKIQNAFSGLNSEGVTGPVRFDSKGNRSCALTLTYLKNGIPVR